MSKRGRESWGRYQKAVKTRRASAVIEVVTFVTNLVVAPGWLALAGDCTFGFFAFGLLFLERSAAVDLNPAGGAGMRSPAQARADCRAVLSMCSPGIDALEGLHGAANGACARRPTTTALRRGA